MAACCTKVKDESKFSRSLNYITSMGKIDNCWNSLENTVMSHEHAKTPSGCNIHDVLDNCNFPLQVKVIQNEDQIVFLGNPHERSTQTILASIRVDRVKCLSNNDQYVYIPLDLPKPVLFTQIENTVDLVSILDVLKYKRKDKLSWLVVTKRFDYKETVYEAGDILEVEKSSLTKRIIRLLSKKRWRDQLSVISHPNKHKSKLPSYVQGHFKKCRSPYSSCYRLLSDLVPNKEMPFLITLPKDVTEAVPDISTKSNKLIAVEEVSHTIIFLCDPNDDIIVQAIPTNIPINIEVLNDVSNNSHQHINFNKYKDSLIANLATLECCPVYLKDLFPTRISQKLCSSGIDSSTLNGHNIVTSFKSASVCEVRWGETRGLVNKSSSVAISPATRRRNVHSIMENEKNNTQLCYSLRESPPIPSMEGEVYTSRDSLAIPSSGELFYVERESPSMPSAPENGGYLEPVTDISVPVYCIYTEIEEQVAKGTKVKKTTRKDEPIKNVKIGKDGYVIVPPIKEGGSHDEENNTLKSFNRNNKTSTISKGDSGFTTKLDLLFEAKFGSPPKQTLNDFMELRPVPSLRSSMSPHELRTKPLPKPKPVKNKTGGIKPTANGA